MSTDVKDDKGKSAHRRRLNSEDRRQIVKPLDRGYGWVIATMSFLSMVVVDGYKNSYGVLIMELTTAFNVTTAAASFPFAVSLCLYPFSGILWAPLVNRFGHRPVVMTGAVCACIAMFCASFSNGVAMHMVFQGVLGGLSLGMAVFPSVVIVGHYFKKYLPLATGMGACGQSVSLIVMMPLARALVDYYGWRGAYVMLAGVLLQAMLFGAFFREIDWFYQRELHKQLKLQAAEEAETGTDSDKNTNNCLHEMVKVLAVQLLKSPAMVILLMYNGFLLLGFYVFTTYLPALVVQVGGSSNQQSLLMIILGVVSTITRIVSSIVAVKISFRRMLMFQSVTMVIAGLLSLSVPFLDKYWMVCVYACLVGIFIAPLCAMLTATVVNVVGVQNLSSALGWVSLARGVSSLASPPIGGFIKDVTGSFTASYYFVGFAFVLCGITCSLLLCCKVGCCTRAKAEDIRMDAHTSV